MAHLKEDLILDYLEDFREVADRWFKEEAHFLEERYAFFKDFFEEERIQNYEWQDIQKLGQNLHCFSTNKLAHKNAFGRPNHEIEQYRKSLTHLAHGSGDTQSRVDDLLYNESYKLNKIGPSSISELVGYLFPEDFVIYNSRSLQALKILEINIDMRSQPTLGSQLKLYTDTIRPIFELYKKKVGTKTNVPLSFEIDQFFSFLSETYESDEDEDHTPGVLPTVANKRVWTYAPGENAYAWDFCISENCATIMWENTGDLHKFDDKEELRTQFQDTRGTGSFKNDVLTCWNFAKTMEIGDYVIAKSGRSKLLGIGKVTGDYTYHEGTGPYYHRRKVEWLSIKSKDLGKNLFAIKTLSDITGQNELIDTVFQASDLASGHSLVIPDGENASSLNTLFVGPPGTGKTYEVRRRAVELLAGEDISDSEMMKKYHQFLKEGRIKFVTFHPNYGYENFVEGLFPEISEESEVIYEIKPGSFKTICEAALSDLLEVKSANSSPEVEFESAYQKLTDSVQELEGAFGLETLSQKKPFKIEFVEASNGIKVVPQDGHRLSIAKKRLKSIYLDLKKRNIHSPTRADIKSDSLVAYIAPVMRFLLEQKPVAKVREEIRLDPFEELTLQSYGIKKAPKNYVLIIDEMNRGNIPSIFGELITLIEPSKRIGAKESLTVELGISKTIFGVPKNLHILGTMNTADRSVEALDIALRRRFTFQDLYPNYDLPALAQEIDGVSLKDLLETINLRIEYLKDRDYTIGHSYFLGIKSKAELVSVFENKIIPLLQEYFFNDWEKLGLILGSEIIRKKTSYRKNIFANFSSDIQDSMSDKVLYEVFPYAEWLNVDHIFKRLAGK